MLAKMEMGGVVFVAARGVVLVHRERAEHIARMLLGGRKVQLLDDALALPARPGVRSMRVPLPQHRPLVVKRSSTRWRDIVGWLGIVAGVCGVRRRAGRCRSMIRRCSWLWCWRCGVAATSSSPPCRSQYDI